MKENMEDLGFKLTGATQKGKMQFFSPGSFQILLLALCPHPSPIESWKTHCWAPNLPKITWVARQSVFCSVLCISPFCHSHKPFRDW